MKNLKKNILLIQFLKGKISNIKDFSIYLNIQEFDIDGFLHANDLSYTAKPEEEIKKYQKGDEIEVKVLEIKAKEQKLNLESNNYKKIHLIYLKIKN